ncbi:replication protein [Erwinia sp. MYb416]|uniref:replication protein n=1 Tax=Erwinia sp. MYb416 TaxID=3108532 RepID=UPI00403F99C6
MDNATQSKNARRIESALLNKLATISQKVFAERLGVAEYVERRVADLDDGYVRLATMILEEMAGADFTKRQLGIKNPSNWGITIPQSRGTP